LTRTTGILHEDLCSCMTHKR